MKLLRHDIRLILKGLREIGRLRRHLLSLSIITAALEAIYPFINIYMTGLIIGAIALKQEWKTLVLLVCITVASNLLMLLLLNALNSKARIWEQEFDILYERKLNCKFANLKYEETEDPSVHALKEKIRELKNMSGKGLVFILSSFRSVVKSSVSVAAAASLVYPLFISYDNSENGRNIINSPVFSVLLLACIIFNVFLNMNSNRKITQKMYTILNNMIPFNKVFGYYLDSYISTYHAGKDIRLYNQKEFIDSEIKNLFDENVNPTVERLGKNESKYRTLTTVSAVFISALTYLFVGLKALLGMFDVGMVVRYVGSINEFTNAISVFMTQFTLLRSNSEALALYFDFMEKPEQSEDGFRTIGIDSFDNAASFEFEFKNVSFKYPGSDNYALKNVSAVIGFDRKTAIVGKNGSGKTTFIKLLCRLYTPCEGQILFNGTDIREFRYEDYLSLMAVVFQDFQLLSAPVGQNVSAGSDYDEDTALRCLDEVGLRERIESFPAGLESFIYKDFDQSGIEISGGEAQKTALARALYKGSPLVILDEPTSALDPIAEFEIYKKFNEVAEHKAVIFISHRMSACTLCDDIMVFDNGMLVQTGAHGELLKDKSGVYFELWSSQAQHYIQR